MNADSLRIAPIECKGVYDANEEPLMENGSIRHPERGDGDDGLPLAILSTPKPAQARFYAAQDGRAALADALGLRFA